MQAYLIDLSDAFYEYHHEVFLNEEDAKTYLKDKGFFEEEHDYDNLIHAIRIIKSYKNNQFEFLGE
jgi:hypothetical protein